MNRRATECVKGLPRIESMEESYLYEGDVFLFSSSSDYYIDDDNNVCTIGFDKAKDKKAKDLLRIVEVLDAINAVYRETNVLSPSVYVHSLADKPWHITTQSVLVTKIGEETKKWIKREMKDISNHYGRHNMDKFWLPCSKPLDEVSDQDYIGVFNRRISGWDGSLERPVVELLGAGGHLQTIWDTATEKFVNRSIIDNLKKEFDEEVGISIRDEDITTIGGFINTHSHELVILSCIFIDERSLKEMQEFALDNIEEDTDGIYLGSFMETMDYYRREPTYFAGGIQSAETNFPNNREIMERIIRFMEI